jgi:hypothetical protein
MDDVLGLLAFVSLIAAQFLAVVVAYSERFDKDPLGGQRFATCVKRAGNSSQGAAPMISSATCFADANPPTTISHCTS